MMLSEWLTFEEQPQDARRKTSLWHVYSKRSGYLLGEIRWYGGWRQYVFCPCPSTIFNRTCLRDLAAFCEAVMECRR